MNKKFIRLWIADTAIFFATIIPALVLGMLLDDAIPYVRAEFLIGAVWLQFYTWLCGLIGGE